MHRLTACTPTTSQTRGTTRTRRGVEFQHEALVTGPPALREAPEVHSMQTCPWSFPERGPSRVRSACLAPCRRRRDRKRTWRKQRIPCHGPCKHRGLADYSAACPPRDSRLIDTV